MSFKSMMMPDKIKKQQMMKPKDSKKIMAGMKAACDVRKPK